MTYLNRRIPLEDPDAWTRALEAGELCLDGKVLSQDTVIQSNSRLSHTRMEPAEPEINIHLSVVYEDKALLVLDKPHNLPVHPCGRYHHHSFSVIAEHAWPELTLKLVHRLDAATSGLLLLAKTASVARDLVHQFEHRRVKKSYLARVYPEPTWTKFECNEPIGTHRLDRGSRGISKNGQEARTRFVHQGHGIVEAQPITGRTNQIRVHLSQLRHPIMGDTLYGGAAAHRLFLHASTLQCLHPLTQEELLFHSAAPQFGSDSR